MSGPDRRPHLLFLCHRIPFPPNKGDKIRSYHLLRFLARHYQVHLGAFVDDPEDLQHAPRVAALCRSNLLRPLHPTLGRLKSLSGLLTGSPLTLPYYRDRAMARWVKQTWASYPIRRLVVFSSAMAQYAVAEGFAAARRVIDFVDVDSDKWRQYAAVKPWYSAWIFRREARRLAAFDKGVARAFDLSLFVSPDEAALFRRLLGEEAVRVEYMVNGVDTGYFSQDPGRPSPFVEARPPMVFTGAMDYWANADAMTWFCREVLPRVRRAWPQAQFHIVGARPDEAVRRLAGDDVVVWGAVPDVRPYLQHAAVVVAPMRIARGIQNKVLEGMAMARPVVVTGKGLEGIAATHGEGLLVADEAEPFADGVAEVLAGRWEGLGARAREHVCRHNSWDASLQRFLTCLEDGIERTRA
jgi:sugar transferase (PEP-CTERM/EpsH1 system associated)